MKIIGHILIFAGVMNIIQSIAKDSSSSNNPLERAAFGFFFYSCWCDNLFYCIS
jgi:hypothetical protein